MMSQRDSRQNCCSICVTVKQHLQCFWDILVGFLWPAGLLRMVGRIDGTCLITWLWVYSPTLDAFWRESGSHLAYLMDYTYWNAERCDGHAQSVSSKIMFAVRLCSCLIISSFTFLVLSPWNTTVFVVQSLPDCPKHCYFINMGSGKADLAGALVGKIPFSHPKCVPGIIEILRHQVAYNSLISSCVSERHINEGKLCGCKEWQSTSKN